MGLFSFKCAKTGVSIPVPDAGIDVNFSEVVLITPNNSKFEGEYDGYGRVDGFDIFVEVIRDLHFDKNECEDNLRSKFFENFKENEKLIKIVRKDVYEGENYEDLDYSPNCEYQGFFYPQWYIDRKFNKTSLGNRL